jgi:apurinic endonuclease APN1
MKQRLGLQINYQNSPYEVIEKARALDLPFFQCFLTNSKTGILASFSEEEIAKFTTEIRNFSAFYVHGAHLINLATLGPFSLDLLKAELKLATRLNATHFVFHLGSAGWAEVRSFAFPQLVRTIDIIADFFPGQIILENTAHGSKSCGSNILDFVPIFEKITHKNRVSFCLDTAHAYSYGYPLLSEEELEYFFEFLARTIGLEKITLLHLNDTQAKYNSRIDHHALPGQGNIKIAVLNKIVARFPSTPLIVEPPIHSHIGEKSQLLRIFSE